MRAATAPTATAPPPAPAAATPTPTNHLDEQWAPVTDPESGVTVQLPGPTQQRPVTQDGLSGIMYQTSNQRGPALGFLALRVPDGFAVDFEGGIAKLRASLSGPVVSDVTSTINGHPTRELFIGRGKETAAMFVKLIATPTHEVIVNVVGPDQNVVEVLAKQAFAGIQVP